jgi:phage shock protein PspC (stress-responsive transcriptional regulator)
MQRVVHASLHGHGFAIEEEGYQALRAYLDRAAQQLSADPDRDEILGDLEQAIADKCARHLAPHKSVVLAPELKQVLDEMGPVGTPGQVGPAAPGASPPPGPPPAGEPVRRLYRVLEGGLLAGLCSGFGAYLGVDANIVRAIFVVLAVITHGAWLLVYLVLVFVVPAAGSPEERAAARGLPFSAQELIDEAKRHYANLERELHGPWAKWKARWWSHTWEQRHHRRQARRAAREARRAWRAEQAGWTATAAAPPGAPPGPTAASPYAQQLATGVVVPVLAFLSAAFTVVWIQLSAMLIVTGKLLDWSPGLPLWASLLILFLVMGAITRPIGHARAALHRAPYPGAVAWLAAWDGILWLGFVALLGWLAWNSPGSHLQALVHDLPGAWEKLRDSWRASR